MYEKLIRREFGGSEKVQRDINTALVGLTVDKFFTSKEIRANINTFILKTYTALYPNRSNPEGIVMILGKTFKGTAGKLEFINDNTKTRPESLVSFADLATAIALTEEKIPKQELVVRDNMLLSPTGAELTIGKLDGLTVDQLPVSTPMKTALDTKVSGDNITYISDNQHNNIMMINNGKLYTTSGLAAPYRNIGTGRGYSGDLSASVSLGKFTEVNFDGLPSGVELLKVGGNGSCINYALFSNNWLYTWGGNEHGVCGVGHTNAIPTPVLAATDCVEVYDNTNWNDIVITLSVFLHKKTDGYVYGSGYNGTNPLGLEDLPESIQVPRKLEWLGPDPIYVGGCLGYNGVGYYQKADGSVWSSGRQNNGVLFNSVGNAAVTTAPVDITDAVGGLSGGDVVYHHFGAGYDLNAGSISNTFFATLLRRDANGNTLLYTVGNNEWGQIGSGLVTNRLVPYLVPNMTDIKDIAVTGGGRPTLHVLKTNKDFYSWGHNGNGLVGRPAAEFSVRSPKLILTGVDNFFTNSQSSAYFGFRCNMFVRRGDDILVTGISGWYMTGLSDTTTRYGYVRVPELSTPNDPVKFIGSLNTRSSNRAYIAITESNQAKVWGSGTDNSVNVVRTISIRRPEYYPLNIPKSTIITEDAPPHPTVTIDNFIIGVSIEDMVNISKTLDIANVSNVSDVNWVLYQNTLPSLVPVTTLRNALDSGLNNLKLGDSNDGDVSVIMYGIPGFTGAAYSVNISSRFSVSVVGSVVVSKTSDGWVCAYGDVDYTLPDGVLGIDITDGTIELVIDGVIQTTLLGVSDPRSEVITTNPSAVASNSITHEIYPTLPVELYNRNIIKISGSGE